MFKILNDAFDDGYKRGLLDAQLGKSRSAFSFGTKEGVEYLTGLANREHYFKSFSEGYNKGYLDGLRQNNLQSNQFNYTNKTTTMARGIDGQLELLGQMKHFLSDFTSQSSEIISKYSSIIRELDSELLDQRILQRLEESFTQTETEIRNIVSRIESEDLNYVQQNIKHLEETPR